METGAENPLPADDARRLLAQLETDKESTRYPSLPVWFFVAMTSAIVAIFCAQLLETPHSLYASFAVVVAAAVLGGRYWLNRPGVAWASVKASHVAPFVVGILLIGVACVIVAEFTGMSWVWPLGGILAGAVVWFTGRAYRRMVASRG